MGSTLRASIAGSLSVVLLALLACSGCGSDGDIDLVEWTVVSPEGQKVVRAPAKLDDVVGARGGSYQLRSRLELPPELRGRPLTLAIPRFPALLELRVDGELLESAESSLFIGYRTPGGHRWRIPARLTSRDALLLELTAEDRWFQATWLSSIPRVSTEREGDSWFRFVTAFNLATNAGGSALVFLIGLSYLIVYLGHRSDAEYGWFAAQALSVLVYPLFMFGPTQWGVGLHDLRVVPIVTIAALVSVGYTHAHFGLARPSRLWYAAGGLTVASVIVAGGPFSSRWGIFVTVATVSAVCVYQLNLTARLVLEGTRKGDAATLLASWVVLGGTAGLDLLYWIGLGDWQHGLQGAGIGISVFAVLQTTALSREHQRIVRDAHALNEELKRQVGERSRQLSHALARLGRAVGTHAELEPGVTIDDRYRVVRRLGAGAMATVYEVERIEDGRRFALKQLRNTTDTRVLARFAREAHIAAEVSHPNLVGIHDIDFASGGFMYIVMDLVPGGALTAAKDRWGDVAWALEVLRQSAHGLAAMHEKGVIHRDLKPGNILIDDTTEVVARISDFGVSGMLEESGTGPVLAAPTASIGVSLSEEDGTLETMSVGAAALAHGRALESPLLTQAGHLLGTPAYMGPELLERDDGGPARDVFSFGVVAFELLTGERPYPQAPLLCRIRRAPAPEVRSLAKLCTGLDPELTACLQASVSLDPSERPSVDRLVDVLERHAGG